jgi:predicted RNase H-like HicB family nuclease
MKQISVELLSDQGNNAVIRLPERSLPGVLIQGDSLSVLIQDITEVKELIESGNHVESLEAIRGILEYVTDIKERYETACRSNGIT